MFEITYECPICDDGTLITATFRQRPDSTIGDLRAFDGCPHAADYILGAQSLTNEQIRLMRDRMG